MNYQNLLTDITRRSASVGQTVNSKIPKIKRMLPTVNAQNFCCLTVQHLQHIFDNFYIY